MMAYKIRNLSASRLPKSQRGIASIVFVVLVSLAVTASSLGVMHSIKSSQEIYVASNAVTHTENGTWLGAEAFRLYLLELGSSNEVNFLNATTGHNIVLSDTSIGSIKVDDISVQSANVPADPTVLEVSATIVNEHSASKSSSAIRVVYHFTPPPPPPPVNSGEISMSFDGDLTLTGGLELYDGGEPIDFSIDGNLVVGGVSVNALGNLRSVGKVTLDSQVQAESIYANDDVLLKGSARANIVQTLGSLTTIGSAGVSYGQANGFLDIGGHSPSEELWTLETATIKSANHQYVNAAGNVNAHSGPLGIIEAEGDVNINNWFKVDSIVSESNVNCSNPSWDVYDSLSARGEANNCKVTSNTHSGVQSIDVKPLDPPVPPYVHQSLDLDVWTFRDSANYFFEYDAGLDKIKVTVAGINGVTDDVYYIGDYGNPNADHRSYLCKTFNAAGKCSLPTAPLVPVCLGNSLNNGCIEYEKSTNTFTFVSVDSAPGIMFFDGNLHLQNGHGMSTFLVSGNITTGGSFKTWAPNFGGYSKICEGDPDHLNSSAAVKDRYQSEFADHYPRSFCNIGNGTYLSQQLGTIAMAAGGYHPSDPVNYVGGDITLGSASEVVGSVFAGNNLFTGGDVDIRGLVSASSDGDQSGVQNGNVFSGKTVIDLQPDGEHYDPTDVPIEDGEFVLPAPDGAHAKLHWVKYL